MAYCTNCGNKLRESAKFCTSCGAPVKPVDDNTKRQSVYEGKIHKCPNCGQILSSFYAVCPSCGYELRDVKPISSVRELSMKLEIISARRIPDMEDKAPTIDFDFINISVFGNEHDKRNYRESMMIQARNSFEEEKSQEKASLIINFVVPNTIEDILEFMFLAESNIKIINDYADTVEKAWITKMEQVYQKAEMSMQGLPEYKTVRKIYLRSIKRVKNHKLRPFIIALVGLLFMCFFIGLIYNWKITIITTVILVVIAIITIILIKQKHLSNKED